MPDLLHLQSRIADQPLLLEPTYTKAVIGALQGKFNIKSLHDIHGHTMSAEELKAEADSWMQDNPKAERKPYKVVGSYAVIPVVGSLVNKLGYLRPYSGMTGYDGIQKNIEIALEDENVDEILLDMNSSGGEVSGCFELADYINENKSKKPITSIVNDRACSACYALASATSKIVASETATIGSIGVVVAHFSYEKMLEDRGVEVTLIHAGKHKVDGNPYEHLSDEVYKRFKGNIEEIYDMFAERVAKFRDMSVESVKATEALTYMGKNAIDAGLADEVVSTIEFMNNLSANSVEGSANETITLESPEMAEDKENQLDAKALAAKATADATASERTRIQAILSSEEAEGRGKQAQHLAFNTSMSSQEAIDLMAVSAKEQPEKKPEEPKEPQAQGAEFNSAMAENSAEEAGEDGEDAEITAESNPVQFAMNSYKQFN